jgi:hypothetical protein
MVARMMYIDPSAGSIILQVLAAGVVGGALTAKRWWGALKDRARSAMSRLRRG